jgi:hypothetical protein
MHFTCAAAVDLGQALGAKDSLWFCRHVADARCSTGTLDQTRKLAVT